MLKIYFDDVLINEDSYAGLNNEYKLFNDSFYLGSVASNTFELKVLKSSVASHPSDVTIEDDNTTFHSIVDKVEEEKGFYNYTLVDKMVNFNFNYDAKPLIDEKAVLEEETYLSDILADMCLKAGVELDYVMTNDIIVSWYDSRIQARDYLSFIAELEGGYACIDELGKLTIKPHKKASSKEISVDEVSELIIGEKKKITRVVFDNGLVKYEFGDDTGNTLYLNQNNVFITDETVVENIYNKIVDFEFYTLTVPNVLIDSSIKAGDVITFKDGEENEYQTIAQYSSSYAGGWVGSYDFNINTNKQEETKILGIEEQVLSIKTEIDRTNATLRITAEQTEGNTSRISIFQQDVNGMKQQITKIDEIETRTTEVETSIEGVNVNISGSGGINDRKNSSGQFKTTYHTATNVEAIKDTTLRSEYCFKHTNQSQLITDKFTARRLKILQNGSYVDSNDYFVSWKINNQLEYGKFKITINQYELEEIVQSDSIYINKNDSYETKTMLINLQNNLIEIIEETVGEELTYDQSTEPSEPNLNETWHNTITDIIAKFDGEEWVNTDLNYSTDVEDGIILPKGVVKVAECMCSGGSIYREWQSANGEFKGRNFQFNENGQTIDDGEKYINTDVEGIKAWNGYTTTMALTTEDSYLKNLEVEILTNNTIVMKKISGGTGFFHAGGD